MLGLFAGAALLYAGIICVILAISLANFIAFLSAAIDILNSRNKDEWKGLWLLVIFFLGLIGVVLYLLIGRKERHAHRV